MSRFLLFASLVLSWGLSTSALAANGREILVPEVEYAVPVVAGLEPYSVFPLEDYSVRIRRGQHGTVEYNLPMELTGEPLEIELRGSMTPVDGVIHLSGPLGEMKCAADQCEVTYKNLEINPVRVEQFLRGISQSDQEFAARLRVAGDFRLDPRGFIRPKKKTNAQY